MMTVPIVEDLAAWRAEYEANFLKKYEETGETDFSVYNRPRNETPPVGPAVTLSAARVVLISSAGSYLHAEQDPYDAANPLGDYSTRVYPAATSFERIAYAHDHYDHTAVNADSQVLLPLRHLEALAAEGAIGEVAGDVISFMGYQPDVTRVVDELIPAAVEAAYAERAHAALLVPS